MFETHVNVVGRVASEVRFAHIGQGQATPFATFRLVSTSRRFDRGQGGWVDGNVLWATVVCWRGLAEHVSSSVGKGDPVVVYGSLRTRAWRKENKSGNDIEIVASTVGHDMCAGTSMFSKAASRREAVSTSTDEIVAQLTESLRDETESTASTQSTGTPVGTGSTGTVDNSQVSSYTSFGPESTDVRSVGVTASGALPSRTAEETPGPRPGVSSTPTDADEQVA